MSPRCRRGLYSIQEVRPAIGGVAQETLAAHNIHLQVLVGVGVLGSLLWFAFLISLFIGSRAGAAFQFVAPATLALLAYEMTESSLFGSGGPLVAACWFILFSCAAASRVKRVKMERVLEPSSK